LKKHPSKTPPARPISTSICASKSATKSTSIYTTICTTISRVTWPAVLCSDRQNPVLRPVPGSKNPEGAQAVKGWPRQRPPRSGAETRAAGPCAGEHGERPCTAEHMQEESVQRQELQNTRKTPVEFRNLMNPISSAAPHTNGATL
jgi:hypothetical protein